MSRILFAILLATSFGSHAQQVWSDPYVPPHVKRSPDYVETSGAALKAQVERKLRDQFESADLSKSGTLTQAQARSAGLLYIADNFPAIDKRGAGVVRFDDVKSFLGL